MTTNITPETFRAVFPEFTTEAFPNAQVAYQIGLADRLLSATRWGALREDGILYLTAHNLALASSRAAVAAGGGSLGAAPAGAVSSKSVGGASISYDVNVGNVKDAGLYAATAYGRQYWTWLKSFGAGGIQL